MKQSLIQTDINEAGEITITYVSSSWLEATNKLEVQKLTISMIDAATIAQALHRHSIGQVD